MDAIRGGLALVVAKSQTGENCADNVLGGSQAFKKVLIFLNVCYVAA